MESGLEDRNNGSIHISVTSLQPVVSMESGLEDRNNRPSSRVGVPVRS